MKKLIILSLLFVNTAGYSEILHLPDKFKNAIADIESNRDDLAIGDNGRAISRYQIHKICFYDAREYARDINFSYESLTNKVNADRVLEAYLNRYERKSILNNDLESLAKCWNGGCNWRNKTGQAKKNLNIYWSKVSVIMTNERNKITRRLHGNNR